MKTKFNLIKKQTLDMVSFGLGARVLLFIKGILIAFYIGSSYNTDVYLLAFSASILFTAVIGEGLIVSLIPILQQVDKRDGMKGRLEFTNNVINNSILLSIILMILGFIGAPLIIRLMGPGFKGEEFLHTVKLFRIGLPIICFNFIRTICGGYLQSQHKFKAGAKSGIANNLIYIIYLTFFSKRFGLEGLMITGIIAVIAQVVVLVSAMNKGGYKYYFEFTLKSRTFRRLLTFLIPISIAIGINEINTVVDNAIASFLPSGTIATLSYANGIIQLVLGLFVITIVSALFPLLTHSFNHKLHGDLNDNIKFGFKLLSILIIPISIVFITLSQHIVRAVYERGQFGHEATIQTAKILQLYAVGLISMGLILLIIRIYYAIHDTITPMKIALIALPLNAGLSFILAQFMGAGGLALGTSISVILTSILGIYDLNKKLKLFETIKVTKDFFIIIIAALVMGALIIIIKNNLGPILNDTLGQEIALLFLSIGAGISVYWTILNKFKILD